MAALEFGERLRVSALAPELIRQVAVRLRFVGLQSHYFLELVYGLIQLAQRL